MASAVTYLLERVHTEPGTRGYLRALDRLWQHVTSGDGKVDPTPATW